MRSIAEQIVEELGGPSSVLVRRTAPKPLAPAMRSTRLVTRLSGMVECLPALRRGEHSSTRVPREGEGVA